MWPVFSFQVCLLADVIQHFVDQKLDFDCGYVYEDIQSCITHVHMSGSLHKAILSEPAKFLQKNDFKGENWKDLFDVVVALAAKPNFYTSQRPFR
jgi:hypothetical protein